MVRTIGHFCPKVPTADALQTASGRALYEALQIKTRYNDWFKRMCEYGFIEGTDYWTFLSNRSDSLAGKPRIDHQITIGMAKELCMIQRTEIGKRYREYFLSVEREWNSPEAVMRRAVQLADQRLGEIKLIMPPQDSST